MLEKNILPIGLLKAFSNWLVSLAACALSPSNLDEVDKMSFCVPILSRISHRWRALPA